MVKENIDSSLDFLFHTNLAIERIIVDHPFDVQYIAFSFDNFYNPDFLADLLHNNLPTISSPLRSITTNVHGTFLSQRLPQIHLVYSPSQKYICTLIFIHDF